MKTLFLVTISSTLFVLACNKTGVQAPDAVGTISSSKVAQSAQARTQTAILTTHPWMYQSYYFHYIDQNQKGDPQYVRGNSNNLVDLADTRVTYRKNGTFVETNNGYKYPGTWIFSDAADTVLIMTYDWGTNVNSIIKLTNNHLNYKKPIGSYSHNNFAYSELVTAQ